MDDTMRRAREILFRRMRLGNVRCTCGWPQETGEQDHAPECEIERAWDDAMSEAEGDTE